MSKRNSDDRSGRSGAPKNACFLSPTSRACLSHSSATVTLPSWTGRGKLPLGMMRSSEQSLKMNSAFAIRFDASFFLACSHSVSVRDRSLACVVYLAIWSKQTIPKSQLFFLLSSFDHVRPFNTTSPTRPDTSRYRQIRSAGRIYIAEHSNISFQAYPLQKINPSLIFASLLPLDFRRLSDGPSLTSRRFLLQRAYSVSWITLADSVDQSGQPRL